MSTAAPDRSRGRRTLTEYARRLAERGGLRAVAALTAAVLVVVLYLPVGLVFGEALLADGRPSLAAVGAVLTDPFYVGVLAGVVAEPLAVGRHLSALAGWLAAVGAWLVAVVDPLDPSFYVSVVRGVVTAPVSLGEYGRGVEDVLGLFGFTAYQAAVSTVVSVAVGLPGAWVLARFDFPGRRTVESLTILPFVLPGIMVAGGFVAAFGLQGTVSDLLAAVGLRRVSLVGTLELVVLAHAFYNAPLVTRVTTAAWETVDRRAVETARTLGASRRRAFRDVVAPQLVPAVATGALLTFLFTFMTFPIVLALGGLRLATVEVWVFDRVSQLALTEAAALAVVETALTLGITYLYLRYEAATTAASAGGVAERGAERVSLLARTGSGRLAALTDPTRAAAVAYGLFALVLFVLPMASMVLESVTVGDRLTIANWEFLLQRQVEGAAFQTKPWPAVRNSLLFAAGTLALAVPMGVAVAAVTTGSGDRSDGEDRSEVGGAALETLALAPLAVSGVVVGVGLLEGLVFGIPVPRIAVFGAALGGGRLQVTGPVAVVAAHAVAAYPFVVRNVAPQLAAIDRETVESARVLGATRTRTLLDVQLPLVATGVIAGAAFAVAISVGEFDSTVILAQSGGSYTMPVAVERYLARPQNRGPAMAMGTVLLAVTGAAFVVVDRLGGRVR